ncbi:MAG: adenine nucleotide alpha hydrolase family protein [Thermoanaerobaculia bacterium]
MTIAATIRIDSPDEERVIRRAAGFARKLGVPCYVISVVTALPYGDVTESGLEIVLRNLELIREEHASPVMHEGSDVAKSLLAVARTFGVTTMFVQKGNSRPPGRSIAEQLLYLDPPFNVTIIASEG